MTSDAGRNDSVSASIRHGLIISQPSSRTNPARRLPTASRTELADAAHSVDRPSGEHVCRFPPCGSTPAMTSAKVPEWPPEPSADAGQVHRQTIDTLGIALLFYLICAGSPTAEEWYSKAPVPKFHPPSRGYSEGPHHTIWHVWDHSITSCDVRYGTAIRDAVSVEW